MNHYHLEDFNEQCYMCQRDRAEKAEACAAEMRACLESIGNWNGNMSDYPFDACKHALSTSCGVGWLSPEKVKELNDEIGNLRERSMHAEQAALELAEKNEQMREAIQSLMDVQNGPPLITWKDEWESAMEKARQALERISSEPSAIASQHIARETLDKMKE